MAEKEACEHRRAKEKKKQIKASQFYLCRQNEDDGGLLSTHLEPSATFSVLHYRMGWLDGWRRDGKSEKDLSSAFESLKQSVTLSPKAKSQLNEIQDLFSSPTAQTCLGGVGVICFVAGWKVGSWSRAASSFTTRMTNVSDISSTLFGPTSPWLRGRVVSVSDGDTIRFLHAPTWLHTSRLTQDEKISDVALPIRICTIDTPETAKFGKSGQPFGEEAKQCLENLTLDKMVHVRLLQKDQYGRAVAEVKAPGMFWRKYADQQLLKAGLAEVYRGSGAVYGHLGKEAYIKIEEKAKRMKKGMWAQGDERESAAEYKARLKEESS